MFGQLSTRERVGYTVLACVMTLAITYIGSQRLQKPTPIVVESPPASAATVAKLPSVPAEIVVHVAGAVGKPGVYKFQPSDRVNDAVQKAGGATADAMLDNVNLAAKLEDGSQLFIPHKEATKNESTVAPTYAPDPSRYSSKPKAAASEAKSSGAKHPNTPVNINTASEDELETVPGIGPSTAEKIIEYRKQHGGFTSIDELRAVKGIGEKKLEKMRPFVKVG